MVPIAVLKPGSDHTQKSDMPDSFALCSRCGSPEAPGLTYLTPWGLLCTLCNDDYSTSHGAGEEGL